MTCRYSSSATVACSCDTAGMLPGVPKLPLSPPIKPQLARSASDLPSGEGWRYEPKLDGFRTIAFRDGDEVYLQSRGGKGMNRYFPEVVDQLATMGTDRVVLDGEMLVVIDGVQEFDLLSQRIHPAASRVQKLAQETPAARGGSAHLVDGQLRGRDRQAGSRRLPAGRAQGDGQGEAPAHT
jgi:ATP-dependent DNA ligase